MNWEKVFDEISRINRTDLTAEQRGALDDAEQAVRKQIALPLAPDPTYYGIGRCPHCGVVYLDRSTNYCGHCGQRHDMGR